MQSVLLWRDRSSPCCSPCATAALAQRPRPKRRRLCSRPPRRRRRQRSPKTVQRMSGEKAGIAAKHQALLAERYDLADRPSEAVKMSRGKPVQAGPRAKLPAGPVVGAARRAARGPDPRAEALAGGLPAAAAPQSSRRRHALSQGAHRRSQEAGRPRPDAFRSRFRSAPAFAAGISAADLPHDAPGAGRRDQGPARDDRQLLRAVQGPAESQAARRPAAPGHGVSAATVQRHRRPPFAAGSPRSDLLRLPRERPRQRGDAPGRRHPPAGVPPPHRDAQPPRRQRAAAVRLAAGPEIGRGLHRVRAAGRLFRRRSDHGDRRRASARSTAARRCTTWPSSRRCSTSRRPRS